MKKILFLRTVLLFGLWDYTTSKTFDQQYLQKLIDSNDDTWYAGATFGLFTPRLFPAYRSTNILDQ
jgi:hypothetical protein